MHTHVHCHTHTQWNIWDQTYNSKCEKWFIAHFPRNGWNPSAPSETVGHLKGTGKDISQIGFQGSDPVQTSANKIPVWSHHPMKLQEARGVLENFCFVLSSCEAMVEGGLTANQIFEAGVDFQTPWENPFKAALDSCIGHKSTRQLVAIWSFTHTQK